MPVEDRIIFAMVLALVVWGASGFSVSVLVFVSLGVIVFLAAVLGPLRPEERR